MFGLKALSAVALCAAFSLGTAATARADTIDFETASSPGATNGVFHTEDGMQFDFQGDLDVYAVSGSQGFTSRYIDFHDHDFTNGTGDSSYIEMSLVGGGTFDFVSADIFAEPLSGNVYIYSSNGDVWTSSGNGSATNVSFNWAGVSWVRFDSYFDVSFDNIVFSAVPEPGTLALLGLGLAGVVAGHRRRSRRAA